MRSRSRQPQEMSTLLEVIGKADPRYKPHGLHAILQLGKNLSVCNDALTTAWCAGSVSMLAYYGVEGVCDLFRKYCDRSQRTKPVMAWRGISPTTPARGMSWTQERGTAAGYAVSRSESLDTGYVLKTLLEPEMILWETRREVLVDPRLLREIYLEDFTDNPPLIRGVAPIVTPETRERWTDLARDQAKMMKVLSFLGVDTLTMPTRGLASVKVWD